jgi:pimeloyl-ACP methyl ester carboxylesterase
MILLGGMTGKIKWNWEDLCSPDEVKEIQKNGYAVTEVNDELRKIVKTDANILHELKQVDQKTMMQTVNCPVLFIHGDADQLEKSFLDLSKKALPLLPQGSELKIIQGASHNFLTATDQIIELTNQKLQTNF